MERMTQQLPTIITMKMKRMKRKKTGKISLSLFSNNERPYLIIGTGVVFMDVFLWISVFSV